MTKGSGGGLTAGRARPGESLRPVSVRSVVAALKAGGFNASQTGISYTYVNSVTGQRTVDTRRPFRPGFSLSQRGGAVGVLYTSTPGASATSYTRALNALERAVQRSGFVTYRRPNAPTAFFVAGKRE